MMPLARMVATPHLPMHCGTRNTIRCFRLAEKLREFWRDYRASRNEATRASKLLAIILTANAQIAVGYNLGPIYAHAYADLSSRLFIHGQMVRCGGCRFRDEVDALCRALADRYSQHTKPGRSEVCAHAALCAMQWRTRQARCVRAAFHTGGRL
jgi:hypothetical protein